MPISNQDQQTIMNHLQRHYTGCVNCDDKDPPSLAPDYYIQSAYEAERNQVFTDKGLISFVAVCNNCGFIHNYSKLKTLGS